MKGYGWIKGVLLLLGVFLLVGQAGISFGAHDTMINPLAGAGGAYPQNPSEEYQVSVDRYLLNFSAFQYMEQGGNWWVKAVVTVKDKTNGEPYKGPLRVVVLKKSLLEEKEVFERPFDAPFENRYITYASFNREGRFVVRVFFDDDRTAEFSLTVGSPGGSLMLIGTLTFVLLTVVFLVYRKKTRKKTIEVPAG